MDRLAKVYMALCLVGIAIVLVITYEYLTATFVSFCNINSKVSCEGVFLSGHTSIFGIPFYALGLFWFPFLMLVGYYTVRTNGELDGQLLFPLLLIGDIFTIYLWYDQLVVIGIICPLCVATYLVNYALTVLSIKLLV